MKEESPKICEPPKENSSQNKRYKKDIEKRERGE